jgi:hypothetical protein
MRTVALVLLAIAGFGQTAPPEKPSDPTPKTDASQHAPAIKKLSPLMWVEHVPFVGCEGGKPIPNVALQDESGAICPGVQAPDPLPKAATRSVTTPDTDYEVGTVIVVSVSHAKVVVAADSRNTMITEHTLADGTVEKKLKYDDCACKLIQLSPTILFAADGQTLTSTVAPASILYDAHKLAKLAARNYHPVKEQEEMLGGRIAAIATRWAWDVDFRMHHGFENGWKPIQTLEGIFVGLDSNGETSIAVAKLTYPKQWNGLHVPPVTFTVGTLQSTPKDYTWITAYGMKDVAETYFSTRAMTEQTKAENKLISKEMLKAPDLFSPKIPEHLVDLTIQQYKASAGPSGALFVHEPIDVAVVQRKKGVQWIRWKKCSEVRTAQPQHTNKTAKSAPSK